MHQFKCVVVGDGYVGKTSLLMAYTQDKYSKEYIPTVFENHNASILVNGIPYVLQLWDTAGQEDYDRLRPLSYPNTHIFLLCFSFDRPHSLSNLETKWLPEIRHHCPKTPFLLVGTKSDLKETSKERIKHDSQIVTSKTGKEMRDKLKACGFVECSAKTRQGINTVFEEAVKTCIDNVNGRKPRPCQLL